MQILDIILAAIWIEVKVKEKTLQILIQFWNCSKYGAGDGKMQSCEENVYWHDHKPVSTYLFSSDIFPTDSPYYYL